VAELLFELGVTRVFTTVTGGFCSDESLNNSVLYLTDCYDSGGNYPVAHRVRRQIFPTTRHLSNRLLAATGYCMIVYDCFTWINDIIQ